MTLGQKIKMLRTDKGLTQKDLADQVHVTFQTVSKWEKDENEPDVSTLRHLAKMFDCSIDYLVSEEEVPQLEKQIPEQPLVQPVNNTFIIHQHQHQRELHVCECCKKDIPENELEMEQICVRHAGRGRSAEYRQAYYHRSCLNLLNKQRKETADKEKARKVSRAKKMSFGWGIAGGVVAFITSLLIFLINPECKHALNPAVSILLALLIGYAIFAMLYCIISGSYIDDVFLWCAGLSIKFPGLIFSWDIEGFIWAISMKILFAVLGFMIGIFALLFAIAFSSFLGMFSFPFVLIHNVRTDYEDAI